MIKRNKKRLVGIEKKKYLHGGRLFSSILRLMTKSVVILASSIGLLILLVVLNTTFYPAARPFSTPLPGSTESFTPIINNNHHISDDPDYHSSQIITHSNPQSSSTEIKDSTEDDLERFFREIERVGENLGGRRLTFNESLRCDIEQDKLQNQPYTVFVTSSNSKFIQLRQRSEFSHSLWQNRIPYPLWMYHENTWEIAYGRNPLKKDEIPQSDCFLDVFEAVPNLLEFLQNEGSYVNEFYKIDGVRSLSDSIMDGKALIRKVAAMAHAANQLPLGSHLIWVDVDTEFVSKLDSEYYNFTNGKDIVYIVELICRRHLEGVKSLQDIPLWCYDFKIETGVVSIRVSKKTRNFLNTALKWYNGPMLALARKCLLSAATTEKASRSQFGQGGRGHGGAHNPASSSSTTTSSSSSSFMSSSFCEIPWIRNNIGLNDVFVLNMLLHRYANSTNLSAPDTMLKQGWFANMEFMCQSSNDDNPDDDDDDDNDDDDDDDDPVSKRHDTPNFLESNACFEP